MDKLPDVLARKLTRLGSKLIDQQRGRLLVQPTEDADGFWFGGGNCVRDPREGSALKVNKRRIEIMVFTEKFRPYPRQFIGFQKPDTGLWSIDTFGAANPDRLNPQESIAPPLASNDPAYLHLKDPNLPPGLHRGQSLLLYDAHPYSWSSSTSGSATLSAQSCISDGHDIFPRGSTWDVAASRITCRLPVPKACACASSTRTKRRSTGHVDTPARNWADWPTASTVNFPPCIGSPPPGLPHC